MRRLLPQPYEISLLIDLTKGCVARAFRVV